MDQKDLETKQFLNTQLEKINNQLEEANKRNTKIYYFLVSIIILMVFATLVDKVIRQQVWGFGRGDGQIHCYSGGKLIVREDIKGNITKSLSLMPMFGYVEAKSNETRLTNADCIIGYKNIAYKEKIKSFFNKFN